MTAPGSSAAFDRWIAANSSKIPDGTPLQPLWHAFQAGLAEGAMERQELLDAVSANQVFHTPLALRRRGGEWDEYEWDAIKRTKQALSTASESTNS